MTSLIKYEAARSALAECRSFDEVKGWADKAAALQAYGRMAQDKGLEVDAAEIRIRAERRLGEMLSAQKAETGLARPGPRSVVDDDRIPTLAESGISKDLSSRAQKLAAVPAAEFEAEVGDWRGRVKAEGARVTARLEAAGERAISGKPGGQEKPAAEPVAELEARIAELEDELDAASMTITDLDAKVHDLDAKVRAAETVISGDQAQKILKLEAHIKTVELQRDDFMRKSCELIREVNALRRRLGEK